MNGSMCLKTDIASAIKKADSSYFFENYSKQANAVLKKLEAEHMILPKDPGKEFYKKVADVMKTGKMTPEAHIKDVYETILKVMAEKK